jgi:hypothetical protein
VLASGCYASHSRDADASVDANAAAEACTFSFAGRDGARVTCRIDAGSMAACDEAARCVCVDRLGGAPSADDLSACVVAERTPRALITFSDFCSTGSSSMDMREVLEGYFRSDGVTIAPACAEVPALFGPR